VYLGFGAGAVDLKSCQGACDLDLACNAISWAEDSKLKECNLSSCASPSDPPLLPGPPGGIVATNDRKRLPPIDTSNVQILTGSKTPFCANTRISFFGDSITWLGRYEKVLGTFINASQYTKDLGIVIVNRGIDGATAQHLRDGDADHLSFKAALQHDRPTVIGIQIGINDVWWAGTKLDDFTDILKNDLVLVARKLGIQVYVCTISVIGERRDGSSIHDPELDAFSASIRKVAKETEVGLVELRIPYLTYDALHNGRQSCNGLLTYDGVHPATQGAEFLANRHALGLMEELKKSC